MLFRLTGLSKFARVNCRLRQEDDMIKWTFYVDGYHGCHTDQVDEQSAAYRLVADLAYRQERHAIIEGRIRDDDPSRFADVIMVHTPQGRTQRVEHIFYLPNTPEVLKAVTELCPVMQIMGWKSGVPSASRIADLRTKTILEVLRDSSLRPRCTLSTSAHARLIEFGISTMADLLNAREWDLTSRNMPKAECDEVFYFLHQFGLKLNEASEP